MKHVFLFCLLFIQFQVILSQQVINCQSKNILTPVSLDIGDTLYFSLENQRKIQFILVATSVELVFTTLDDLSKPDRGEGSVYKISCKVEIDGQVMSMERFIPVQQTFTDPYLVNGCYIWFDAVQKIKTLFPEKGSESIPDKDARFAFWDATNDICPEELTDWYPGANNYIDVRDCYNGDDTWMGTYFGGLLHGGLDVNMPVGTPLYAPIDFDDNYLFASLKNGDNNNRWRGIKNWNNGNTWILQSHHIVDLLVKEHQPVKKGAKYAYSAGILAGDHPHTHFIFKSVSKKDTILLDPWLLFWKIFEDNKKQSHQINARMQPVVPAITGKHISFSSENTLAGVSGNELKYYWTFGDGGISLEANPQYIYMQPGIYPVSLHIADGTSTDIITQHITVNGESLKSPGLGFESTDQAGFMPRKLPEMNVFGNTPVALPEVVLFCRNKQEPALKKIRIINTGTGNLPKAEAKITYIETANKMEHLPHYRKKYHPGFEWLSVELSGTGNDQEITFQGVSKGMEKGETRLHALVEIDVPGAINSPAVIPVLLYMPDYFEEKPADYITVDNSSPFVVKTDWFWLSPRTYSYDKKWSNGYNGSYLINSGIAHQNEFVRYQPDLEDGSYQLAFSEATPFKEIAKETGRSIQIPIRIQHKNGISDTIINPLESLIIGKFDFILGKSGYVDILAPKEKEVLTIADAIIFKKIK